MQLTQIQKLVGQIELVSGLHIGGSSTEMHIGGTDNLGWPASQKKRERQAQIQALRQKPSA